MKKKKLNNRILAGILIFAMLMTCVPLFQIRRAKAASISDFVNDARWCNGINWGDGQRPKLSGWSSSGCCAYVCDFVKYVYGHNSYKDGATTYTSVTEIREGDVIYTGNHYFAVFRKKRKSVVYCRGKYGE